MISFIRHHLFLISLSYATRLRNDFLLIHNHF
nr:MAG TPA: hypothetical protein [Caudoviricetes sp.]